MNFKSTLMFLFLCFSFAFANGYTSDKAIQKIDPQKLYKSNCTICHGSKGKLGIGGATDLSKSAMSVDDAVTMIGEGKGLMTGFEGILTKKEIKAIAKYIQNLKK